MSPEVEAAIIAGGVGILTVIVSLYGTRKTSQDTKDGLNKQLDEQRTALNKTLQEQREALNQTLQEQREALEEQRTRTLNERFATAADRLGSDKPPAVQLAGVYAMAGLADDWTKNRQTCVEVLCAYLRMPYEPDPGGQAPAPERLAYVALREVRHTVIRVITAHLQDGAPASWQGLNFDFTGVVFDGGSFAGANFSGGTVDFTGVMFPSGTVDFGGVSFSGGRVSFGSAEFCGAEVDFAGAKFSGSAVNFTGAKFTGGRAYFGSVPLSLSGITEFSAGDVSFILAEFRGGTVDFSFAKFSGASINFGNASFADGKVSFGYITFSGGYVGFDHAGFSGGTVDFTGAEFSGSKVFFSGAEFAGGTVDFSQVANWAHPPTFDTSIAPPVGMQLPPQPYASPRDQPPPEADGPMPGGP